MGPYLQLTGKESNVTKPTKQECLPEVTADDTLIIPWGQQQLETAIPQKNQEAAGEDCMPEKTLLVALMQSAS
jgi:hypothetical protein